MKTLICENDDFNLMMMMQVVPCNNPLNGTKKSKNAFVLLQDKGAIRTARSHETSLEAPNLDYSSPTKFELFRGP